jgi:hypothetical protein
MADSFRRPTSRAAGMFRKPSPHASGAAIGAGDEVTVELDLL